MKKPFTLIELLLVISVITILMTLLLPALASVRETAKRIKCIGNQRQVGMIWMSYCSEYNGHLPGMAGNAYTPGYLDYWPEYMQPYFYPAIVKPWLGSNAVAIRRNSILECPSAPFPTPTMDRSRPAYGMLYTGIGGFTIPSWGSAWATSYRNIAQVKSPSRQPAFSDNYLSWDLPERMVGWFRLWPGEGHFRHSKNTKLNMIFCDGHVETKGRDDPIYKSLDVSVWANP
ncbi:MAG: hypothetical protein A2X49_07650 [Lentisphaerae bacterium GWF2_52_8]|nr:MAG: hypothetical protein A2X49_07650 [Lentisphaerae bacterium GWF2_52_8]